MSYLIFMSCVTTMVVAQDSLSSAIQRKQQSEIISENFTILPDHLVSNIFKYSFPLTEISFSGNYQSESQAVFMQKGDGYTGGSFTAEAYMPLNQKSKIWGKASYQNGIKRNIIWNESSDLDVIYPYVMGDSIGGDMYSESYYFNGGYAQKHEKIIWGGELSYRALQEYRNVDPRPKNTVADFKVKLGIGYNLNTEYTLMLSGKAGRYKQTGNLVYYSEQGQSYAYHLTGLGMDYTRFAGTNNDISYKGTGWGGSIDLFPKNKTGITVSAIYDFFSLEKIVNSLNYLPMIDLKEHKGNLFIAWTRSYDLNKWGANVHGGIKVRKGTENIFGDHANNAYPQIAESPMYQNNLYDVGISGFFEKKNLKNSIWSVQPVVKLASLSISYLNPERKISTNYIEPALSFRWSTPFKKVLISINAEVGYTYTFNNSTLFTDLNTSDKTYELVTNTANSILSDKLISGLKARCDIACFKKSSLFIQAYAGYDYYRTIGIETWNALLSIGILL